MSSVKQSETIVGMCVQGVRSRLVHLQLQRCYTTQAALGTTQQVGRRLDVGRTTNGINEWMYVCVYAYVYVHIWDLHSSGMLGGVDWYLFKGVSGQSTGWTAWLLKIWPLGCPETSVSTNIRHVTFQKSKYLIYTAVEALNHTYVRIYLFVLYLTMLSVIKTTRQDGGNNELDNSVEESDRVLKCTWR